MALYSSNKDALSLDSTEAIVWPGANQNPINMKNRMSAFFGIMPLRLVTGNNQGKKVNSEAIGAKKKVFDLLMNASFFS
jgi:hypothetical protein